MMLGDSSPSPPFGAPTNAVWLRGRNSHSFSGRRGGEEGARATGKAHNPPTFTKFGTPLPTPLPTRGSPAADPATHPREPSAQCASGEPTTLVCGLLGRDNGEFDRKRGFAASRSPARAASTPL